MASMHTKTSNALWRGIMLLILSAFANTLAQAVTLTSIDVTPGNPIVDVGQTQAFTATGTFSDTSMQLLGGSVKVLTASANHGCALLDNGTVQRRPSDQLLDDYRRPHSLGAIGSWSLTKKSNMSQMVV